MKPTLYTLIYFLTLFATVIVATLLFGCASRKVKEVFTVDTTGVVSMQRIAHDTATLIGEPIIEHSEICE
jgi:outer membrane murein-binding lipoprotein Lpp